MIINYLLLIINVELLITFFSVEEIVTEAVMQSLKGSSCKMHPCGREDIDVRCLG